MNIAVVGLGSMGKRRIRLIQEMYTDYRIVGIDGREARRKEAQNKFEIPCYENLSFVENSLQCVFVCTSPLSYNDIIIQALNLECHVFSELKLVADRYSDNINLAVSKGLVLFLSSTFFIEKK